ncbi:MAG: sugar porter family MFS transporter [Dysgonamonadaceae bacterium]|jgi:sugar porter (SP) family MFS transporter|nr:sugar porter family MFS transporter [Dysgonamonadaceae bacterium]
MINFRYLIFLSFVAALGGFLFGYDTAVISGTVNQVSTQFGLDTIAQGWYVGCALVGSIAGVMMAGWLSDRYGRKNIMILSSVLFSISAIGCAVSADIQQLVIYRIVGGIGIGVASIVSPLYISEISAAKYRGSMVTIFQLAITVGFFCAYLVNFGLLELSGSDFHAVNPLLRKIFSDEVWRGMLGAETFPAVLFFITIFFIPESPRWLLVKQRENQSLLILNKIYLSNDAAVGQMNETKQTLLSETRSEWRELWKPGIRRAVIIGVAIAMLGQFMGVNAVLYYGPTIFENNGLSGGDSLFYQVMVGLANTAATVIALFIIDRVGRKKLIYFGVSAMIFFLLLIAVYFSKGESWGLPNILLLVFFMAYIFSTAISISAVVFVLLSEMYPNKVRGLAMSVAGLSLWTGTFLIGQLTPWLLANLTPAGTFVLFALMCIPYMLIMWKTVPETAGMSLEAIEEHWINSQKS